MWVPRSGIMPPWPCVQPKYENQQNEGIDSARIKPSMLLVMRNWTRREAASLRHTVAALIRGKLHGV